MLTIVLISILVGAGLGWRFKVLVLLPAIVVGVLVVMASGIAYPGALSSFILSIVLVATGLQIGYLAGVVIIRYVFLPPQIDHSSRHSISRPAARQL
jgi:hypothetical protein